MPLSGGLGNTATSALLGKQQPGTPISPAEAAALDEVWNEIQSACGGIQMAQVYVQVDVSVFKT